MSLEQLAPAVRETDYLKRFDRHQYENAFREYGERFGPLYAEAIRAAGEAGLADLAASLMDELEAGWRRQRIWNRTSVQINEKQMMVAYLSPMLVELEAPLGVAFAKALRDTWSARRPKDGYRIASYEKLASGFRNTILGIDVSGFINRREQESQEEEEF